MMMRDRSAVAATDVINVLSALLKARTGQVITLNRQWRIETALKPLTRARGHATLEELVSELHDDQTDMVAAMIVDALLNQESSFFRDPATIDLVVKAAELMHGNAPGQQLRIWSAGCSTGQEPLSLAMCFAEKSEFWQKNTPEIVATDVSGIVIAKARAGRFSQFEIQRGLPIRRMIQWFAADGSDWVASQDLLNSILFRKHNLVGDPAPAGKFDIILCRNVLFYLPPALRNYVFEKLAAAIRPGGLLVLGAGETVIGQTEAFAPSQNFRGVYQLTAAASAPSMIDASAS